MTQSFKDFADKQLGIKKPASFAEFADMALRSEKLVPSKELAFTPGEIRLPDNLSPGGIRLPERLSPTPRLPSPRPDVVEPKDELKYKPIEGRIPHAFLRGAAEQATLGMTGGLPPFELETPSEELANTIGGFVGFMGPAITYGGAAGKLAAQPLSKLATKVIPGGIGKAIGNVAQSGLSLGTAGAVSNMSDPDGMPDRFARNFIFGSVFGLGKGIDLRKVSPLVDQIARQVGTRAIGTALGPYDPQVYKSLISGEKDPKMAQHVFDELLFTWFSRRGASTEGLNKFKEQLGREASRLGVSVDSKIKDGKIIGPRPMTETVVGKQGETFKKYADHAIGRGVEAKPKPEDLSRFREQYDKDKAGPLGRAESFDEFAKYATEREAEAQEAQAIPEVVKFRTGMQDINKKRFLEQTKVESAKKQTLGKPQEAMPETTEKEMWSGIPVNKNLIGKIGDKIADAFQVEPRFKRLGARDTGISIKAINSRREATQEQAERMVIDLTKNNPEFSDTDWQKLNFIAYTPKEKFSEMDQPTKKKFAKAYGELRKAYNKADREAKANGIYEAGFVESMKRDLREERVQLNETIKRGKAKPEKLAEYRKQVADIQSTLSFIEKAGVQYVHIPKMWLAGIWDKSTSKTRSRITEAFHKRKTVDMEDLARKLSGMGIIKDKDMDARNVFASYMHVFGNKLAVAKVFRTAEKDGLVKDAPKAPDNWSYLPSTTYPSLKGKKVHPVLADFFEKNFTRGGGMVNQKIGKVLGTVKVLQFYNPFFLTAYDTQQSFWTGALTSPGTPSYVKAAMKSAKDRDSHYWNMHEHAGFSKPFTIRHSDFMKRIEKITTKQPKIKKILDDANLYQHSWDVAWGGDKRIRMITYHYELEQGLSPKDAAQVAARVHGDYASLPPRLRRTLNKIMFTPSFKISMLAAQTDMLNSAAKTLLGKSKGTPEYDKAMGKALGGLAVGIMAREAGMRLLGFKPDKFGLKYVKTVEDEDGKKRELVFHIATPDNVLMRLWSRVDPQNFATDVNKFSALMDRAKWEAHPVWQIAVEVGSNRGIDFQPIWTLHDDPSDIALDVTKYVAKRVLRVLEVVPGGTVSPAKQEARRLVAKDFGSMGRLLEFFVLPYTRGTKRTRNVYYIKRLQQIFKEQEKDSPSRSQEQYDRRMANLMKRIKKLQEEIKESK